MLDFQFMSVSFPLVCRLCAVERTYGKLSCFDQSPGEELSMFLAARREIYSSASDEQNQKKTEVEETTGSL